MTKQKMSSIKAIFPSSDPTFVPPRLKTSLLQLIPGMVHEDYDEKIDLGTQEDLLKQLIERIEEIKKSYPDALVECLNYSDTHGTLVLNIVQRNLPELLKEVLKNPDIDTNFKIGKYGISPLFMAIRQKDNKCLELLLEYPNTDPNLIDYKGDTPLLEAVQRNNLSGVKALLTIKLNALKLEHTNNLGQTALGIAKLNQNKAITDLLLKYGCCDIDKKNIIDNHGNPLGSEICYDGFNAVRFIDTTSELLSLSAFELAIIVLDELERLYVDIELLYEIYHKLEKFIGQLSSDELDLNSHRPLDYHILDERVLDLSRPLTLHYDGKNMVRLNLEYDSDEDSVLNPKLIFALFDKIAQLDFPIEKLDHFLKTFHEIINQAILHEEKEYSCFSQTASNNFNF